MSALPKRFFTPEKYLELEAKAEYKSQYIAGEIFPMAGAQPSHDRITGNIFAALHRSFRGRPCDVFTSDLRVRAAAGDLYTYPDVTALCGEPKFEGREGQPPSLLNPQVIFEVLSPSTEAFDRGEKFARYRRLETRRDYVLVSAESMRVEHHRLQASGVWAYDDYRRTGQRVAARQRGLRAAAGGNLRARDTARGGCPPLNPRDAHAACAHAPAPWPTSPNPAASNS